MNYEKNYRYNIVIILILFSIIKLLYFSFSELNLFSEEAQYWLWSKHLDWNYYSKPLMVAVLNFISTSIFGDNQFAIKFNAVLLGFGTAWLVFEFSLMMFKNSKTAFYAVLVLLIMPFYHVGTIFHTTDSSLYFFWVLSLFLLWKAWESDLLKWWIFAGLAAALGILSKNIMILIIPIMGLFLALTAPKRLLNRGFWIFCFFTILSGIPILIWNFHNDFVTFRHLGTLSGITGKQVQEDFYQTFIHIGEYIVGQVIFLSPFLIPILFFSFKEFNFKNNHKLLFLILPVVVVWLFFLGISFLKNVYVNWPAFGMLTLSVLVGHYLSNQIRWRKYFKTAGFFSLGLMILIITPHLFDSIGFKQIYKPSKDPLYRLTGYRELGNRVDQIKDSLALKDLFIFSDSYHIASQMAFYVKDNPQTYAVNMGRRMNQFDLWPGIDQFEEKGFDAIYITREPEVQKEIFESFDQVILSEKVVTLYRSDTVRIFHIAVLKDFHGLKKYQTEHY